MHDNKVPGLALAVVDQGTVTVQAYGVVRQAGDIEVGGDTRFYVASLAKLYTALAVLHLEQRGRVNLDEDVNQYLPGWQIDNHRYGPITLRHLLTHAAGLDDRNIGYVATSLASREPLAEHLQRRLPARIREPGTLISYSNYSFGLAGAIVEAVGEKPFGQFVEEEVFKLLGLQDSAYLGHGIQPSQLETVGHRWTGEELPLGFSNVIAAGGAVSSIDDMAKLLSVMLGHDSVSLPSNVLSEILTPHQKHHPHLPGRGLAMWQRNWGDQDLWAIGGSGYGFASAMLISPEHDIGLAVLLNRQEPGRAMQLLDELLAERIGRPDNISPSVPHQEIERLKGTYRWLRYSTTTAESLIRHFIEARVNVTSESELEVTLPTGRTSLWRHIGDGVFENERGEYGAFSDDYRYLFSSEIITMPVAMQRVAPYDTGAVRAWQFITVFAVALLGLIVTATAYWRRRRWPHEKLVRSAGLLLSIGILLLPVTAVLAVLNLREVWAIGPPFALKLSTLWPFLLVLLSLFLFYALYRCWSRLSVMQRLGYLWLGTCSAGLCLLATEYHWLGWQF